MKKIAFTLALVVATALTLFSQKEETILGKSGLRLSGAWGTSSTNLTFYGDETSITTGSYWGLEFGKSLLVGWGGFNNTTQFRLDDLTSDEIDLDYNGFVVGYAPKAYKAIHPNFMMLIGGGRADIDNEGRDGVFVVQPSVGLELNVLRWFRIGIDGGYRYVGGTDFATVKDSDLSAPFGQLTFKFGYSWGKSRSKRNDFDD